MHAPRTYAEWLPLLDRMSAGDDTVLDVLVEGEIEWTNVVAERWTRRVSDCLTVRLQSLTSRLQLTLDRAAGDYYAVSSALLSTRRGLDPLRVLVSLRACPCEVREHLQDELTRWATATQESLERHARVVRDDQGRLSKSLRDNPLTAAPVPSPVPQPPSVGQGGTVGPARGRRVIL